MLDVLITGAAAGIIGCLSGQGIMTLMAKNSNEKLEARLLELESKELVVKDSEFVGRSEIQELMTGFATQTQQALNTQYDSLVNALNDHAKQTSQAARLAEARAQVQPSQDPTTAQQMAQMYQQVEQLTRQING